MRSILFPMVVLLASLSVEAQEGDSVYLFSYFMDNGQDGLHLAWSEDGLQWEALPLTVAKISK